MYVGVGIEEGIDLLSKFLVKNLKEANLENSKDSVIFIPDSFEELLQTKKSISGLWALGDVYAALKDYRNIHGEDSSITIKDNNGGSKEKKLKHLDSPIRRFYTYLYGRRSPNYFGIPDRLAVSLNPSNNSNSTINIEEDSIKSPAHLYASVNYMSIAGREGDQTQQRIVNLLLKSESNDGWYVNGMEISKGQKNFGWPLFPRNNNKEDKKSRLVDPIASLNVLENLAKYHDTTPITDLDKQKFIFQAWVTSLADLAGKDKQIILEDNLSQKVKSFIKENPGIADEDEPGQMSSDNSDFTTGSGILRGYHDICRSLLAITGILEKEDFHGIIEEEESNLILINIVVRIIKTLLDQLKQDIISVDKIHDRGRVFRRSNGLVVQYIGVGSALTLYAILRALKILKKTRPQILNELYALSLKSVVRTLIIKVLQQIMTKEHINFEPTRSLRAIRSRMKSHNILQDYEIIGGYVFDECLPGKADAYEFIFFWQSAYALRALLLCQDLAKEKDFSWLTHL